MSDYTPTTEEVRDAATTDYREEDITQHQFDRWLAEVKAEAWEEGFSKGVNFFNAGDAPNPYRQEESSGNSNSQTTAESATYLERERIRANIIERVQDLTSCHKNDNCQEFGALIASYIEEWIDGEKE